MKTYLFVILLLIPSLVLPQSLIKGHYDDQASHHIVGKCVRTDLQNGEFSGFFIDKYNNYTPKIEFTDQLTSNIYNHSITIVLGTWCRDSQEQIPAFFKILDQIDYNTNYIEIICVDRNKSAGFDISFLNIKRVPTFIFFLNGLETGRIVETPILSLEEDILQILKN